MLTTRVTCHTPPHHLLIYFTVTYPLYIHIFVSTYILTPLHLSHLHNATSTQCDSYICDSYMCDFYICDLYTTWPLLYHIHLITFTCVPIYPIVTLLNCFIHSSFYLTVSTHFYFKHLSYFYSEYMFFCFVDLSLIFPYILSIHNLTNPMVL